MEELTIVEMEPPEENECLSVNLKRVRPLAAPEYSVSDEEESEHIDVESKDVEIISFHKRVINRKEQLCTGSTNMMKNRINSLRLFERNAFRLEVALFLKLVKHDGNYNKLETYYDSKTLHFSKRYEGESCINHQILDSPNLKLKLTL